MIAAVGVAVGLAGTGCTALQQVSQLRKVQFRIDRVEDAQLAGIELEGIQSYEDIRALDVARLASKVANGRLPLSFTVQVGAQNPSDNDVNARLTQMDWTVLLQDRETVSGTLDREVVLRPGQPQTVPVAVSLNLVEFFDRTLEGLIDLAVALGKEGDSANVELKIQPTVQTPVGAMRYPTPITVARKEVGGA